MSGFAIEAGALALPFSGVQRYVVNIVNGLSAQLDAASGDEPLTLLYRWRRKPSLADLGIHGAPRLQLWHKRSWPLFPRYAALLCTHDRIPDWRLPIVSTIFDLYQEQGLVSQSDGDRARAIANRRRMVERSTALLCISETTRDALLHWYPEAEGRAAVVPLAADARFAPVAPDVIASFRRRLGLVEPYLLFTGVNRLNKNLPRLVAAFAASGAARDYRLLLAGSPGAPELEAALESAIRQHRVSERVQRIGFVDDADLPTLYASARAFVFPSLVEGFGLPVLEAMRCGTPVLTSAGTSCSEVSNGHAVLVDAREVDDIARGIDDVLKMDASAREQARLHASTWTWERTAARTLAALRSAAAERA